MFEFFVGLKHLVSRSRQSLSIISVISIFGVFLGVMSLVTVVSVASGFEQAFKDKVLGVNSHILIMTYAQDDFREYREVQKIAEGISPEILATAPFIFHEMMVSHGSKISGILIKGVDTQDIGSVSDIVNYITPQAGQSVESILQALQYKPVPIHQGGAKELPPPVLIGRVLSEKMKLGIGDTLRVISPKRGIPGEHRYGPVQMQPTQREFRIVGLYDSGFYDYDNRLLVTDYKALQDFFNLDDVVTGVEIRVSDINHTTELRDQLLTKLNDRPGLERFRVIDWQDLNNNLFMSLKLQKIALSIIMMFIVIVASFNILGTLIMMVLDKQRDISILKSMGANDTMIMRIFIFQGLFIGGLGTALGLLGGWGVCELISMYDFGLDAKVYFINELPVILDWTTFAWVGVAALFISFAATLYPSWWATQLDLVEGLRYD